MQFRTKAEISLRLLGKQDGILLNAGILSFEGGEKKAKRKQPVRPKNIKAFEISEGV